MNNQPNRIFRKLNWQIFTCISILIIAVVIITLLFYGVIPVKKEQALTKISSVFYKNYDVSILDESKENKEIKYGYQLFNSTPKYLGPYNGNEEMVYQGNRLACKNCHLNSGTKPYAAPLIGVIQRFPQYRGREDKIGTIQDRINGCMERSMNGKMISEESKEMKALVKYLEWISRYAPNDGKIEGQGFVNIEIPNRAVNLNNGKQIFTKLCTVCHTPNGKGIMSPDGIAYTYPPLWGEDSYNNGAGMARVITAAQFIKANMPFGTTYNAPILTDEEAYDVAGFINQQNRPQKSNPEKDFPDLKKKPVSTPYPPYVDTFSVEQHQLGPYQPIIQFYKQKYNITKTN